MKTRLGWGNISLICGNSAHEPQNACIDYQQLTHFEVHGRSACDKFRGSLILAERRFVIGLSRSKNTSTFYHFLAQSRLQAGAPPPK